MPWGGSYSVGAVGSEILKLALTVLEISAKNGKIRPIFSSFGVDDFVHFKFKCGLLKCQLRVRKLVEN